jgi:hypothetical protein
VVAKEALHGPLPSCLHRARQLRLPSLRPLVPLLAPLPSAPARPMSAHGASAAAAGGVTRSWRGRARERAFLAALLQPRRFVSHVIAFGGHGQGKTTIVLDLLQEANAHAAYVDCLHTDRHMLKRLAQQVADARIARLAFPGVCLASFPGEQAALPSSLKEEARGRKRKSAVSNDVAEIPMHPQAMPADLAGRAGATGAGSLVATAAANSADVGGAAASSSAAPISGGVLADFQHSTRSQLTDLVRTISGLRHAAFLASRQQASESGSNEDDAAALQPDTLFLVLDNVHRLPDASSLLASLTALPSHTQYPVCLILLAPSLSHPSPGDGPFSLPAHLASKFTPVAFRPYAPTEVARILAEKMWRSNRAVERAFRPASSADEPLTPAQASRAFALFEEVLISLVQTLAEPLGNAVYETENQLRRMLPTILHHLHRELSSSSSSSSNRSSLDSEEFEASQFTARMLQLMERDLKETLASVWELPKVTQPQVQQQRKDENAMEDVAPPSSAAAAASSSSTSKKPTIPRGQLGLPSSSASSSSHLQSLLSLSSTSKFLLLSSFLASYNPPSADTVVFTVGRQAGGKKWNRKGKSVALERKRERFDSASSTAQAQISQLQLGPNAATLERVLAIYQVVCGEDEEDGEGTGETTGHHQRMGLASCYAQLRALMAASYIEQLTLGGGSSSGGSLAARKSGDLLSGVRVRCLLSAAEMEAVCASIETTKGKRRKTGGMDAGAGERMGERITLNTYLYDAKRR